MLLSYKITHVNKYNESIKKFLNFSSKKSYNNHLKCDKIKGIGIKI